MNSQTLELVLLSFPVLLLAFCVHEFMHAWVALKQGDDTAYQQGRVTLDPRAHIDPLGSIVFPLVGAFANAPIIGWAKPTPTNPSKYRNYKRGDILVSLAGVVGNLGLALLFAALHLVAMMVMRRMGATPLLVTVDNLFRVGVDINVALIFFNLLPVPPLDGSRIIVHFLSARGAQTYAELSRYGVLILYGLLFMGGFNFIGPLANAMNTVVVRLVDLPFGLQ